MANITIPLPASIGNMQDAKERRKLYSYLYRLSESVDTALKNISPENLSGTLNESINELESVSEKAKALADMLDKNELAKTKNVRETYQELRDTTFSTVENITASFNSLIEQTQSEITSYVEANFIAEDPQMTLEEKISSMIQQTADAIRLEFNTIANVNAEAINDLSVTLGLYFNFSETGLEIGRVGDGASSIVTRITNEKLEFIIAGTETVLAYFDGATNKLKINMAEIDTLSLGNDVNGYVDIDMGATGLLFKWRS